MNINLIALIANLLLIFFLNNDMFAQCNTTPCTVHQPSINAQEACVLPNSAALNCYSGNTTFDPPVSFPPSWCTTVENNHWFAFTADADSAVFKMCTSGCPGGGAIQAAVLSTIDCIDFAFVSPCLGNIASGTCQTLVANNLMIGNVYYLMIDGNAGAVCNYTINGVGPIAIIEPAGPISIAYGGSITLDAGTDYLPRFWSTGDTTQKIIVSECGIYWVEAVDSNGCPVLSASVTVTVSPIVTFSNGVLMSTPANTYQWLLNGDTIPGATNQTFVPTISGDYSVLVNCSGTGAVVSNLVPVVIVGVSEASQWQIKMYPNPVSEKEGSLTLNIQGFDNQSITFTVTDLVGRQVFQKTESSFDGKTILEIKKLPVGSYLVKASQGGNVVATGMFLKI